MGSGSGMITISAIGAAALHDMAGGLIEGVMA